MDDGGNATAVWEKYNITTRAVYANRCSAGNWGTATLIGSEPSNGTMSMNPEVAMDAKGDAMVVWSKGPFLGSEIHAISYSSGNWGTPAVISSVVNYTYGPRIAMDAGGDAIVVWQQYNGSSANVFAKELSAGVWGPVTKIGLGTNDSGAQVAMDNSGDAIVVWQGYYDNASTVFAERFSAGSWGLATVVGGGPGVLYPIVPLIAMNEGGDAVAVWTQYYNTPHGQNYSICANRYSAGNWGTATRIDEGSAVGPHNCDVAIDESANAIIVWQDSTEGISASLSSDGGWGGKHVLNDRAGGYSLDAQVAMDMNGDAIAVWNEIFGYNPPYQISIQAVRYSAGSWGAATNLSGNSSNYVESPDIAMDKDGNAIVVWQQYNGSGYGSISAITYVPVPQGGNEATVIVVIVVAIVAAGIGAGLFLIRRKR